ncbi:MAG: Ada metal-binding domain-containing protein [Inhella sp.]|jgi:AraC family transcriptional regulator of adaptative response / DNA-3-methyladenine glycosylase II|uniref:DNA-3-methyladenine glycosylase 2 family protein n=1 Tax=Inhella sp. TaxID=1921806 RepID=UPI0022C7AC62|nr:Ada metal-binding domain-containing protein [Inhella sp.]MCZ8234330.1 helix-turn-helix domain-containing protein [Inhella sp.]
MQALDPAACYAALQARDARFDGHWFTGVTSTGVYCRPICRVRTPKAHNCRFFPHAAAAEAAGFRPCLKCRPELAPRAFSVMESSRSLAHAARERLDAQVRQGQTDSMDALADALGITARHLRRVFEQAFGVSPSAYLQTQRLLAAKQLLTDTNWPLADVALRAGFGSVRRFQEVWQQHYRLPPSRVRRAVRPLADGACVSDRALTLPYRPPLALEALLSFLAVRAVPGVEVVDRDRATLRRTVRWPTQGGEARGTLTVRFEPEQHRARLWLSDPLWPHAPELQAQVRQWLDLDADPTAIAQRLHALPGVLGLRLPGAMDGFEIAVRAVLGQQVSVAAATTLATRLVRRFGQPLDTLDACQSIWGPNGPWCFPTPEALARPAPEVLATIGLPQRRAASLQALARAWPSLPADPKARQAALQQLPGIGPWTAAYVHMRATPWPDVLLPGDLIVKRQLERWSAQVAAESPNPTAAPLNPEHWAPYRSYATLALWRMDTPAPTLAKP